MANLDASNMFARMMTSLKYEDLPAEVVETTKKSILDTIGVILAASGLAPEPREVINLVIQEGGKKESTILGYGDKVPCYMAAFANGAMAHALDYDDVGVADGEAWGHVGITTVPGALAVSERRGGVSGKEFLRAVALGNEMMYRMGVVAARSDAGKREWFITPLLGVFSTAATSGKLLGLDEKQIINALGVALAQASGTKEIGLASAGTIRAIYGGFSAKDGVLSSLMAQVGVTATQVSLEGKAGLFPIYFHGKCDTTSLASDIGTRFESLKICFKPWCSCAHTHLYIDAVLQLTKEHNIVKEEVEEVVGYTSAYVQSMLGEPLEEKRRPKTVIAAKFSIPFTMALAVARGGVSLKNFTPEGLKDDEILGLSSKARTEVHPDVGTVQIKTKNGKTYSKRVQYPLGSFKNPMTNEQIEAKFRDSASHSLKPIGTKAIDKVINLIRNLETAGDVTDIIRFLSS